MSTPADETRPDFDVVANGLLQIGELMANVAAAVDGYRAQCVARGYSDGAAELMSVEYHRLLVHIIMGGKKK